MQDYSKAKVGDLVWWSDVNARGKGLQEGVICKVGTKLITVNPLYSGRVALHTTIVFRKDSGRTNDNYGHQTLIVDIESYEAEKRADSAWEKIKHHYSRPSGTTYADIEEAARLLKINIE